MEWIRITAVLIVASVLFYGCHYLSYRIASSIIGRYWLGRNILPLFIALPAMIVVPLGSWVLIGSDEPSIRLLSFLPIPVGFFAVFIFNKELVQKIGKIQNPKPNPNPRMFSRKGILIVVVVASTILLGYRFWLFPTLSDYAERADSYSLITNELLRADRGILYSLEPVVREVGESSFYGFKVLGKIDLNESDLRLSMDEFTKAIDSFKGRRGGGSGCFKPRVALRLIKSEKVQDFLLCYECHAIQMHRDGLQILEESVAGSQDKLNELFKAANIAVSSRKPSKGE